MSRRFLIAFYLFVAALLFAAGCGGDGPDDPIDPNAEPVIDTTLVISADGGTMRVNMLSFSAWKAHVASGESWCSIKPTSGGSGGATIAVKVAPNTDLVTRTAVVNITNKDTWGRITVIQKQIDVFDLSVDGSCDFPPQGGRFAVTIDYNVDYTISFSEEWVHQAATKALSHDVLEFEVDRNVTGEDRVCVVGFGGAGITHTVNVSQEGAYLNLSAQDVAVSAEAQTLPLQVASNISYNIVMPQEEGEEEGETVPVAWIEAPEETSAGADGQPTTSVFEFGLAANETYYIRECKIAVENPGFEVSDTLHVLQKAIDILSVELPEFEIGPDGDSFEFELDPEVEKYEISAGDAAGWITVSTVEEAPLRRVITVAKNLSGEDRTGVVTIKGGEESNTLEFAQVAARIGLSHPQLSFATAGGSIEFTVDANVEYTVTPPADTPWFTLEEKSEGVYTASAVVNENETGRECVILFDNEEYGVHISLKVVQAQKDVLELNPTSFWFGPEGGFVEIGIHTNIDFECISDAEGWISENLSERTATRRTYTVSINDTGLPREGLLTFVGGEFSIPVNVQQDNAYILAGRHYIEFEDTPGMGLFSIEHNVDFKVKVLDATWMTLGNVTPTQVSFSVSENNEWGMRDGNIVLYNELYKATDTIAVHQGAKFYLDIEQMEFSLPPEGGTVPLVVTSNKEYNHYVADSPSWISETSPLIYEIEPNTTSRPRECRVVFEQQSFHKEVVITQDAPYMQASIEFAHFPEEGGEESFSVSGNVDVTSVTADAEWVECVREADDKFSIFVEPNPVPRERNCTVTLANPFYGVSAVIRVIQEEKKVFYLLTPEFQVAPTAGDFKVDIDTNMDYKIEVEPDWISNRGNLVFSVGKYTGDAAREGSIAFIAGGERYYVTVTQEAPYMEVEPDFLDFPVEGASLQVVVSTNVPYTVADPVSWLSCEEEEPGVIVVAAAASTEEFVRKYDLQIESRGFGLKRTVHVEQDHADMFVLLDKGIDLSPAAAGFEVGVKTNMKYTCSVGSTWVKSLGNLRFAATKNTGSEPRECLIQFTAGENVYTYTVTQAAPLLEVSSQEFALDSLGGDITVKVTSNIDYSVLADDVDWLTAAGSTAEGEYLFSVAANEDVPPRSCQIVVSAPDFERSRTIDITQTGVIDKHPFSVDIDTCVTGPAAQYLEVGHYKCEEVEVSMPDASWLRHMPERGTDTKKVFRLDRNNIGRTRKATVTLSGNGKSFPVVIIQEEPRMSLSVTDINVPGTEKTVSVALDANFTPQLECDADWVEISLSDDGKTIDLKVATNRTGLDRETTVQVGDANFIQSTISVKQIANKYLEVDPAWFEVGAEGGSLQVRVSSNVKYSGSVTNAWIKFAETEEENVYMITVSENMSAEARSGKVTFAGDGLDAAVKVVQAGYRNPAYYYSSDFSHDNQVVQLQAATEGDGINLVLMGDAFSDRLIADGTYEAAMKKAVEVFFDIEPYRSFRQYFDIYYINVVSLNEEYGSDTATALSTYFSSTSVVGGNHNAVRSRVVSYIDKAYGDNTLMIVLMNAPRYGGTTYLYSASSNTDYAEGESIVYIPLCTSDEEFAEVLQHEAGGHGFGKLADEYSYTTMGAMPGEEVSYYKSMQQMGFYKNVTFVSNPEWVSWADFLTDERYEWDGLGVFEGACTYTSGVWRATENSIMRYNTGGFNAPSREAIYYRLHKLAFGKEWTYDFEDFVEYDEINIKTAPTAVPESRRGRVPMKAPLPSPVIIRQ